MIKIALTYKDGNIVNYTLPDDQVDEFFEKIQSGVVHYNRETHVGFWTSIDQLRHIVIVDAAQERPQDTADDTLQNEPKNEVED